MQTFLIKADGKGEGSRGGKIIGHTKGKNLPIYASHGPAHGDYHGFSSADHSDAAAAHGMAAMHSFKKMYLSKDETKAQKHYSEGQMHQGAAILHSEHASKSNKDVAKKSQADDGWELKAKAKKSYSANTHQETDMHTFLIKADGENLTKSYKHPDELGKTSSGKTVHGLMHNMNGPLANGLRSAGKNVTPKAAANHVHMFNRTFTHQDHGEAAIHHATQAAVLNYKATRAKGMSQVNHMANAERHASLAMAHYHASKATGRGTGAARKSEAADMLNDYLSKAESKGEGNGENLTKSYKHPDELGKTSSGKTVHGLMHNMNGPLANGLRSAGKKLTPKAAASHVHMFNRTFTHQDHGEAAIHHATQAAVLNYKATRAKGMSQVNHMANAERHASLAMAHYHASKATGRGTGAARKSEAADVLNDYFSKAGSKGEGSRGGKIVGHTEGGKPIYAANGSTYRGMHKPIEIGSYNANNATYDSRDRVNIANAAHVKKKYPGFSKEDHMDAARFHEDTNDHHVAGAHFAAGGYYDGERHAHLHIKKSQAADVLQDGLSKSDTLQIHFHTMWAPKEAYTPSVVVN